MNGTSLQFNFFLVALIQFASLQFNLPCANRYICAIACIWLSPKHGEDCTAYRFETARPMAGFSAYHITCAVQTNTSNYCKFMDRSAFQACSTPICTQTISAFHDININMLDSKSTVRPLLNCKVNFFQNLHTYNIRIRSGTVGFRCSSQKISKTGQQVGSQRRINAIENLYLTKQRPRTNLNSIKTLALTKINAQRKTTICVHLTHSFNKS